MTFTVKVLNVGKIREIFKSIEVKYHEEMLEKLKKSTLLVHRTAVKSIREKSHGHLEKRYNPERTVIVSKPGDAPNTDRGTLIQSIGFGFDEGKLLAVVGTSLKYGKWLEFGTKHITARPWLLPALRISQEAIARIMKKKPNRTRWFV